MAKSVRVKIFGRGRNPKPLASISFLGRSKKKAVASAKRFVRKHLKNVRLRPSRRKNIEQGFYDSTGLFHPIRASSDYSAARAGEGRARSRKAIRTRARSHARKARRARKGAIS